MPSLAIPKGSLVVVTGANGYIAAHICDQLLHAGYKVRGTVRDLKRAQWVQDLFDSKYGKGQFEMAVVVDITKEDAFDDAVQDCAGVVHAASILNFSSDPNEVITPTVAAATNILRSAAQVSSVKRVVYTSSSSAAALPKGNFKVRVDSSTWNEEAKELAWAPPPYKDRGYVVYGASKTTAEQKCWEFVEKEKPQFTLNTVLPYLNTGPALNTDGSFQSTGKMLMDFYQGKDTESIKTFCPQWDVDVRDTARIHVLALTQDDVNGERLYAWAHPYSYNSLLETFRLVSPEKEFPPNIEDSPEDLTVVDTSRCIELLKRMGRNDWTSLEDSLREMLVTVSL